MMPALPVLLGAAILARRARGYRRWLRIMYAPAAAGFNCIYYLFPGGCQA